MRRCTNLNGVVIGRWRLVKSGEVVGLAFLAEEVRLLRRSEVMELLQPSKWRVARGRLESGGVAMGERVVGGRGM